MTLIAYSQLQIGGWLDSGYRLKLDEFTFSIPGGQSLWPGYSAGEEPFRSGYATPDAAMATGFVNAIASWDDLIAPDFRQVADNAVSHGNVRLAFTDLSDADPSDELPAYAYFPSYSGDKPGDIWVNAAWPQESWDSGSYGLVTLIHEVGHTLGLEHPFVTIDAPDALNSIRYTVMSYNWIEERYVSFGIESGEFYAYFAQPVPDTPMVLDIAAVQDWYGANPNTRADDTTYTFDAMTPTLHTIYDAGGTDTIDLSAIAFDNIVDLRPGAYSSVAIASVEQQIAYWSAKFPNYSQSVRQVFEKYLLAQGHPAYTFTDNVAIALSTLIENAIGGSGRDEISGNDAANVLIGNDGNDTLDGRGGDDTLNGGEGLADIAVFSGNRDDYLATIEGAGFRIVDQRAGSPDGSDFVVAVEIFKFADREVQSFNLVANRPPVVPPALQSHDAVRGGSVAVTVDASDPDGDALSYEASLPAHGTVTGGADGQFTYMPATGYVGPDSFDVTVSDGNGGFAVQTIDLTVVAQPAASGFRMFAADGFIGSVGGSGQVFGTTALQDITVADVAGTIAFDPLFNKGGDIIRLSGNAGDWQIMRSGSNALFTDGDTFVQVPLGSVGTAIVFDDGVRSLVFGTGGLKIGDQSFGTALEVITAAEDGTVLPTGTDPAAAARLFLAAGAGVSAGGRIDIFGTDASEPVSLLSGDITFDPSFNKGGDILSFGLPASDFLASRIGSSVLLDSATTDARILVGTTGTTLVFPDGDARILLFDTTIPGATIAEQIITATPTALMALG